MKTSELIGPALDWAVARITNPEWWDDGYMDGDPEAALDMDDGDTYSPSTDWAQGGPIIERENITLIRANDGWFAEMDRCTGHTLHTSYEGEYMDPTFMIEESSGYYGPTPLVAAMRCYVASKLGDKINIPEELLK